MRPPRFKRWFPAIAEAVLLAHVRGLGDAVDDPRYAKTLQAIWGIGLDDRMRPVFETFNAYEPPAGSWERSPLTSPYWQTWRWLGDVVLYTWHEHAPDAATYQTGGEYKKALLKLARDAERLARALEEFHGQSRMLLRPPELSDFELAELLHSFSRQAQNEAENPTATTIDAGTALPRKQPTARRDTFIRTLSHHFNTHMSGPHHNEVATITTVVLGEDITETTVWTATRPADSSRK